MGIENLLGLQGRPEAEQKQILEALRDGKITAEEMSKLGLTEKEAKELENMFSMGTARLGDNFIHNKGEEKDARGTWQLTQSGIQKRAELPGSTTGNYAVYEKIDEGGKETLKFYDKAGNRLDCKNLKEFYAFEGRSAEFNDKAIPYIDKDGKIQQHLLELKKDEKTTDIRTEAASALLTIATGGSVGMIARMAGALLIAAGITSLQSCTPEPDVTNIRSGDINTTVNSNQNIHLTLTVQLSSGMSLEDAVKAIIQAIKDAETKLAEGQVLIADLQQQQLDILKTIVLNQLKQGAKIDEIIRLLGNNNNLLKLVLDALTQNNTELAKIKELLEKNSKQNDEILEAILKIQKAIDKLGQDQAANFVKVINAINNFGNKLPNLEKLLNEILEAINNNTANDDKNAQLILDAIANLKLNGGNVDLSTITQLLQDIKGMFANVPNYMAKFDAILAKLDSYGGDIVKLLNDILEAIKNHTCNCNCSGGSGSHEGILDDITGLIS